MAMELQQEGAYSSEENDPVIQYVTFSLAGEVYGVNVMQVQEVLRYTDINPVPGSPNYVLGIINLRGSVVTVIDTRKRFGLPPNEITDNSRIVIVEVDKQVAGILVDSVAEVVYIRASKIETNPSASSDEAAKFIQGVCHQNETLIILIDANRLLSDEEWQTISEF